MWIVYIYTIALYLVRKTKKQKKVLLGGLERIQRCTLLEESEAVETLY